MSALSQQALLQHHPLSTQPEVPSLDSGLVWFRRDLRAYDHAALFYALRQCQRVFCVFVFDKTILDALPKAADRRVEFIWESIVRLQADIQALGGELIVLHETTEAAIPALAALLGVQAVFTNKDYEPAALVRDTTVAEQLKAQGQTLYRFKDQVIFEEREVLTQSGGAFTVFTPYKNAWLKKLDAFHLTAYPIKKFAAHLSRPSAEQQTAIEQRFKSPASLESMGFERTNLLELIEPGTTGAHAALADFAERMHAYKTARDFPAVKGVSYLSVHMRFGTLSIRRAAKMAWDHHQATGSEGSMGWLNELVWRDFYFQIIHHRPDAAEHAFKADYDKIEWEQGPKAEARFKAWCEGNTGFPLVDAAMRQLNQTGYQHNRLRMVTASFLTKDLGLDWRWGERYFAEHLNDFDLSANNGGWQWAASSGCDAQPYFRIFNPTSQSEKFDPDGKFIRRYCPELAKLPNRFIHNPSACPPMDLHIAGVILGETYPRPVVDHAIARETTLTRYAVVKKPGTV